jgi:hypothetical protein
MIGGSGEQMIGRSDDREIGRTGDPANANRVLALSLGERVRDGAFASRRGTGEGSMAPSHKDRTCIWK